MKTIADVALHLAFAGFFPAAGNDDQTKCRFPGFKVLEKFSSKDYKTDNKMMFFHL